MGVVAEHEGIVLSVTDVGEEDRILTFITRDCGLLRAAAGGARGLGKGRAGALDLFAQTRLSVYRSGKAAKLPRVREVELSKPFLGIRRDYGRLCAASYMAEVVSRCVQEDDPVPGIFDLLSYCLRQLDREAPVQKTLLIFEARILAELGFSPETETCGTCGAPIGEYAAIDPHRGGFVHSDCAIRSPVAVLSQGDLAGVRFILTRDLASLDRLVIDEERARRLFTELHRFSIHHLALQLRTVKVLP